MEKQNLTGVEQRTTSGLVRHTATDRPIDFYKRVLKQYTIRQYIEQDIASENLRFRGRELALYHIGDALIHVYQLVGLRPDNYPKGDTPGILGNYLVDSFPFLAPEEIYQAFVYALQEKYKVPGEGLEHYQVIDAKYLTRVLRAYERYSFDQKKLAEVTLAQESQDHRQELIDKIRKNDQAVKRLIRLAYEKIDNGEDVDLGEILREDYYHWLIDNELMERPMLSSFAEKFYREAMKFTTIETKALNREIKLYFLNKWLIDLKFSNAATKRFERMETIKYINKTDRQAMEVLDVNEEDLK